MEFLQADLLGAAVAAFGVGTVTSYVGNSLLTFRARMTRSNAGRFLAVVLAGLALNQIIAWAVGTLGLNYLFLPLAVFVVVPAFNYAGHRFYSFGG
jgi:putative flippase GtrA